MASSFIFLTYPINPNFLVKLDEINYLIWKEQLKDMTTVYGLHSLVDGSTSIPYHLIKK